MIEQGGDLEQSICRAADQAVQRYVRGILTVEELKVRLVQDWEVRRNGEDKPSQALLIRMAQRICSRELHAAWCSSEPERRNLAFGNLRRYLETVLRQKYFVKALELHTHFVEDVLHQTLSNLCIALKRNPPAGPDDPAAFLKWAQTILIRDAYAYVQKAYGEACVSLDAQSETFVEQFVDKQNGDPQELVLKRELQRAVKNAILSLRNPRYQQVLICTYLEGMDESEVASHLQVRIQDVYLWRHRALKALRGRPEVMQALRPWLQ